MYCLISIVIITTLPPPLLYTKVLKQVNYTMELHDTQVLLSIMLAGWIQTNNPSPVFNDQLNYNNALKNRCTLQSNLYCTCLFFEASYNEL